MFAAVENGDALELAELIKQDPGFNINTNRDEEGLTLLHSACIYGRRSPVIPLLLAHPDINVNSRDIYGNTPFSWACRGRTPCLREMLKDSRVKVNEPDTNGYTPLWAVASDGHLEVIKWWIASGREMELGEPGDVFTDAIGVAKNRGRTKVVALLERFKSDASKTRHAVRVELGWYEKLAAEMFALVVFVSDGLLNTKATPE